MDNPDPSAGTHLVAKFHFPQSPWKILRRQGATVQISRNNPKPIASKGLEAWHGGLKSCGLLHAQITQQLEARRFVCEDHICRGHSDPNKSHRLIHVLAALVGDCKHVGGVRSAQQVTHRDDNERKADRNTHAIPRNGGQGDTNPGNGKNCEKHALPRTAIGVKSRNHSDPT